MIYEEQRIGIYYCNVWLFNSFVDYYVNAFALGKCKYFKDRKIYLITNLEQALTLHLCAV